MKKQRLVHFERIHPEYGEIGFYMGAHNTQYLTKEEDEEFDKCMFKLWGPWMTNSYREFKFFFTKHGLKKHRRLVELLIKVTDLKCKVVVQKVWKEDFDIAYQDKEQVAILIGPKHKIRKRRVK